MSEHVLQQSGYFELNESFSDIMRERLRIDCLDRIADRQRDYESGLRPDLPLVLPDGVAATLPIDVHSSLHRTLIHYGAQILQSVGYRDIKYHAGAIIPRYENEPPRNWHVDWWNWTNIQDSSRDIPPQIGIIFYLDRAWLTDGCLTVVPGSHKEILSENIVAIGTQNILRGAIDVPMCAGGVVMFDARLMHAVSVRKVAGTRLAITLWYIPAWADLSEESKATVMLSVTPDFRSALGDLYPNYTGTEKPVAPSVIPVLR